MQPSPSLLTLSPFKFYQLVDVYQRIDPKFGRKLDAINEAVANHLVELETHYNDVRKLQDSFVMEAQKGTRMKQKNSWDLTQDEGGSRKDPFQMTMHDTNFLAVVYIIVDQARKLFQKVLELSSRLVPTPLMLSGERPDVNDLSSFRPESMQRAAYEMQINQGNLLRFVEAVLAIRTCYVGLQMSLGEAIKLLDKYYSSLVERHTRDGVEIIGDPMVTDVALCILENVDSHGEIEDGTEPDKVSAYSVRKAQILAESSRTGLVGTFIREPDKFLGFIRDTFRALWSFTDGLNKTFHSLIEQFTSIMDQYAIERPMHSSMLEEALDALEVLDPQSITYRDPGDLKTSEERFLLDHRKETLTEIVRMLRSDPPVPAKEMVTYILKRKGELHSWYQDENSFYVCKIGTGNQFLGVAPGALEVVPGTRPTVDLKEIVGEGYDDIRAFIEQVESSAEWHDLFVASSPSRSATKSNVLLIGPQGSGKTEILRGVGADPRSVSIFAQGSDFNTCWAGEASKNPKRLFQAGSKIQKKTGKHVHFLIDEIDAILNNDRQNAGYINLTLEFQILMDGVVAYPHLSVWGTTNNPNRIPMPMIRRFSKVAIVGELNQADRVKLLKHFAGFMPWRDFQDSAWEDLAQRLDGATGDVIRKVVDTVWREMMTDFVGQKPEAAREIVNFLNREAKFDVSTFQEEQRNAFKRMLGRHTAITPELLSRSVDDALSNVGIVGEIELAKDTYENAKLFMSVMEEQRGKGE